MRKVSFSYTAPDLDTLEVDVEMGFAQTGVQAGATTGDYTEDDYDKDNWTNL